MDALVAMVPLAKTPAWTVAVLEASRKAIMLDPAWKDGNYEAPPEQGIRLWRDILSFLSARTPDMYRDAVQERLDVLPWLEQQETSAAQGVRRQRLDLPDLGLRAARRRHHARLQRRHRQGAARSIKAKTLILIGTKDLLNPECEPIEAGTNIRGAKVMTISPGTVTGHAAAGGAIPADVEFINRETRAFLDSAKKPD